MTIDELKIQLDISLGNEIEVLKQHTTYKTSYGYIFVDSSDGQCYLFNKHGKLDDINKVKSIEDAAFEYCTSLKSIVIPDSVKSIEDYAFSDCTSLKSIIIPDSVKDIGHSAFWVCTSLESIIIPNSVESIEEWTFAYCTSLKSIIVPDSVESIGAKAFFFCKSLKSITILGSVKNIGSYAFEEYSSPIEVIFKGKTIEQVKAMDNYPWGIEDTNAIKCQMS